MCGRYKQTTKAAGLAATFGAVVDADVVAGALGDRPRFNAAPTDPLPIVRVVDDRRALRAARWGLLPPWSRPGAGGGQRLTNARSETVAEKPVFRDALRRRRCLVPMDGFYEWKTTHGDKQPYLFSFQDERPFAVAGLWERGEGPAGPVDTFTIVTTAANALAATLHDRMPVILAEEDHEEWLDPRREVVALAALCAPRDWPGLGLRPVSRRLGNVRFDDATLLIPEDTALGPDGAPAVAAASSTPGRDAHSPAPATKAGKPPKPPKPTQGTLL